MKEEIPWYVRQRIPPAQVRKWLEDLKTTVRPRSPINNAQWRAFLRRRAEGLEETDYGNSGFRCPKCSRRLRHFYITRDKGVLKRAEEDPDVRKLISGYTCYMCSKTYFAGDLNL